MCMRTLAVKLLKLRAAAPYRDTVCGDHKTLAIVKL